MNKNRVKNVVTKILCVVMVLVLEATPIVTLAASGYDIDAPIINKVTLTEKGREFTNASPNSDQQKLHFTVSGYDEQGKIVKAYLYGNNDASYYVNVNAVVNDPSDGTNVAKFEIPIGDIVNYNYYADVNGDFKFTRIEFVDDSGNKKVYDCSNDNLSFNIKKQEINVNSFSVANSQLELVDGESVETSVRLELDKQVDFSYQTIGFYNNSETNGSCWASTTTLAYDSEASSNGRYVYTGDLRFYDSNVPGEYNSNNNYMFTASLNGWIQNIVLPTRTINYINAGFQEPEDPTSSHDNWETRESKITSITSDRDQQVVEVVDTDEELQEGQKTKVTYTVKTNTDPNWCVKGQGVGTLILSVDPCIADELDSEYTTKTINLDYVGSMNGENIYQGSVVADDLYPCEWTVYFVSINNNSDYQNNVYYCVNSYCSDYYSSNDDTLCNSYFWVKKGDVTKKNIYRTVNVNIQDPATGESQTFTKENVSNHESLSELVGDGLVIPKSDKNLGKCVGIAYNSNYSSEMLLDVNDVNISKVAYRDYDDRDTWNVNLSFVYENVAVNVQTEEYTEYNEEAGLYMPSASTYPYYGYNITTYYVPKNFTEEDLNNVVPAGKDPSSDIKFEKWSLNSTTSMYYPGSYITLEPVYSEPYTYVTLQNVLRENTYNGMSNPSNTYYLASVYGVAFGNNVTAQSVMNNTNYQMPEEADFQGWEVVEPMYPVDNTITLSAKYGKQYSQVYVQYVTKINSSYDGKTTYSITRNTIGGFFENEDENSIKSFLNSKISHPDELGFTGWNTETMYGMNVYVATYAKIPVSLTLYYINNDNNIVAKTVSDTYSPDTKIRDIINNNSSDKRADTIFVSVTGDELSDDYLNTTVSEYYNTLTYSGTMSYSLIGKYDDVVISSVQYPAMTTAYGVNKNGQSYKYVPSSSKMMAVPKSVTTGEQLVAFMQEKGLVGSLADYQKIRSDITGISGSLSSFSSVAGMHSIWVTYKNGSPSIVDDPDELKITKQPQDVSVKVGENFNCKVEASGNGIKYDWQYQMPGKTTWTSWKNRNTASLSAKMSEGFDNMKLRCVITDSNNNSVVSDEVLLKLDEDESIRIIKQPEETKAKVGEQINVEVKASGKDLKYDWQYQMPGKTTWTSWKNRNTASLSAKMSEGFDNMKLRCVITDSNNNSVTSDEVLLKLNK